MKIPNYLQAYEACSQAVQFYLAVEDVGRENEALFAAIDAAIAAGDFGAAAGALSQVARIGTRIKDNQLLLRTYAIQAIVFLAGNDLSKAKL